MKYKSKNSIVLTFILAIVFTAISLSSSYANILENSETIRIFVKEDNERAVILFSGKNNDFSYTYEDNTVNVTFLNDAFLYNTSGLSSIKKYVQSYKSTGNALELSLKNQSKFKVKKIKQKEMVGLDISIIKPTTIENSDTDLTKKNSFKISHKSDEKATEVFFEWQSYTASSVFLKDSRIWFVFDKPSEYFYINDIEGQYATLKNFIKHKSDKNSTVISAEFLLKDKSSNILFYKTGFNWNLKISKSKIKPKDMRVISKPYAAPQPRVEIEFEDTSTKPINVVDPKTGISYKTIPSHESAISIHRKYGFVDFDIIPSIQGVTLKPKSDSLKIKMEEMLIKIEGAASLNIAPRVYTKRNNKFEGEFEKLNFENSIEGYSSIVSLKSFVVEDETFLEKTQKIRSLISKAENDSKKAHIYANLVLFYIANGFHLEALTIMKLVKDLDKNFYNSYNMRLINAVAHYLSFNYGKAYDIVKNIRVSDVPINLRKEVRFWKAITSYMVSGSADYLKSADPVQMLAERDINFLTEYNDKLLFEVITSIVNEKIKDKSFGKVRQMFQILNKLTLSEVDNNRLFSLAANYYASINKIDKAVENWDQCIEKIDDLLNHTVCRFDKAYYLYQTKRIESKEYIEELEVLSYLWHGDELQIRTLKNLGDVYYKNKNYTKALRAWNKIVNYFPFTPDALNLSKKMGNTFVKFFLTEELDSNISHLEALNLFYEFENLIPLGDEGDEIVLKFISHLRSLDLLDRAIVLLKHQVMNRLYGYRKEEMINELVEMYLDNREPRYALEALELGDDYKILPDYIGKKRKYLTAEALYLNGEDKLAIQLLNNDYSPKADAIKSNIFWKQKDWKNFSKHIEPKVYKIRYNNKKLTSDDSESVLKLAIAYLIENEWKLLDELYRDFKKRMPENDKNTEIFLTLEKSWETIKEKTVEADKTIQMIQNTVKDILSVINDKPKEQKN